MTFDFCGEMGRLLRDFRALALISETKLDRCIVSGQCCEQAAGKYGPEARTSMRLDFMPCDGFFQVQRVKICVA